MTNDYGICWGIPEAEGMHRALSIARHEGTFYYAELGCAEGRTFSAVLKQMRRLKQDTYGFAVDQPAGWSFTQSGFDQNLADFNRGIDYQLYLNGAHAFLDQCINNSLSLVLIDACHEKECAALDFIRTASKVRPGGIVVFHDTAEYAQGIDIQPHRNLPIGVRDAIKALCLFDEHPEWELLFDVPGSEKRDERGIVVVRKR